MQMHFDIAVKSSDESALLTSSGGNCKVVLSNSSFQLIATMIYSQVHKYWDIDTILTFLALYTTTMDFKWNEQDVL